MPNPNAALCVHLTLRKWCELALYKINIEKVAQAIEANAGKSLPGLRQTLTEAKAGWVSPDQGKSLCGRHEKNRI